MKEGETVYIRLEGFQPEWRQAVIVKVRKSGQLLLAVRILKSELQLQTYSSFEIASDSGSFILVEGDVQRVRAGCPFPHRALEVDPQKLLTNAKILQEEDDVTFATASEDLPKDLPLAKTQTSLLQADSQSDSGEDSGDSDAIANLLEKLSEKGLCLQEDLQAKSDRQSAIPCWGARRSPSS